MTLQAIDDRWIARRADWIKRVGQLIDQAEQWAIAQGWSIHREEKTISERSVGEYIVPVLRFRTLYGEAFLTPIALHVAGDADGRVDLETWPTLNRVKLVGAPEGWRIITDSNVPLRQPWNRETFVQLVRDLQS